MTALARVYLDKDCSLAEINPLIVTTQGDVVVLDAKMTFDDNALFRHPDIEKLRDEAEENPAELRAGRAGLTYISLDGNIGDLVAEALVKAGREVGFTVPVVVRLEGTNVDKARQILAAARSELPTLQTAADLTEAAKKVVAAAQ